MLSFKEEYKWSDIQDAVMRITDIVIVGNGSDDRSRYFPQLWDANHTTIMEITSSTIFEKVNIKINDLFNEVSLLGEADDILGRYIGETNVVTIDISSLDHHIIMYLCNLLCRKLRPRYLFATYAEPIEYLRQNTYGEFLLSSGSRGVYDVPSLIRFPKYKDIQLAAFLGFEGERLKKILEENSEVKKVFPVIGFPSFRPGWQSRALRNSMNVLQNPEVSPDIKKCEACSIYSAFETIRNIEAISDDRTQFALAPLGTRPHTAACAIYASINQDTLIFYDFPVEICPRSRGVLACIGYNLSCFITR
jgi:hypothetical protein